jgi:hypothetical protein
MTRRLCIACLAILGLIYVVTPEPVRITVEGARFPFEPAYVRVRVTVEPDPDNRGLWIGLASVGDVVHGSYEQLEGDRSPRTRWREFKHVEAGAYVAYAVIERVDGTRAEARDTVTVQARY